MTARRFRVSVIALLVLALCVPLAVGAAELRLGDQPSVSADERIAEDLYIAGGSITSAGVAAGDLVASGGNVLISGGVGGDLLAVGGSLTILGNVADDIRIAGGNLVVQGAVGGDAALAGGQINLGGGGVEGDVFAAGGTVRIDAPVANDARIAGGDIYLNSTIAGDVEVYAEKLTLGSGARIEGNLTYTAPAEATIEEGAVVAGETTFNKKLRTISVAGAAKAISFALVGTFLAQLAATLLLGLFFRRYVLALVESAVAQPLMEVGRGLVVAIVLPVASLMLLYTVIGIPLGILGLISFAGIIVFLWILTPIVLGSLAYRAFFGGDFDTSWKTIILGAFIYTLLGLIPIVGWLTQLILVLLTLGVATKVKWEIVKEWR